MEENHISLLDDKKYWIINFILKKQKFEEEIIYFFDLFDGFQIVGCKFASGEHFVYVWR